MDVSVITVNYNTKKLTKNCIDSIFQNTKDVKFEVILVDNASTDGSKEFFEQDNRIKYIYSTTNLGFGKANNLGYKEASGKYLFLLNSDTLLLNNAIDLFYVIAEKDTNKNIGCWGTMLYDSNGKIADSYGKFLSMWRDLFIQLFLVPLSVITKKPLSAFVNEYNYKSTDGIVDFISGADIFMKKSVADEYGLFDPHFFLYCEETDMQRKYYQHKVYSKIETIPQIAHLQGGSQSGKRNRGMDLIKLKSKMYYFRKWNSPFYLYLYLILLTPFKFLSLCASKTDNEYRRNYFKIMWSKGN